MVEVLRELLCQKEAGGFLGKSVAWMERARWAGTGPSYIKIGRSVRYRRQDLDAYVEAQRRTWTRGNQPASGSRDQ